MFYAHDGDEISREGDTVLIAETRPLSKTKRWRVVKVVSRAAGTSGPQELAGGEESGIVAEASPGAPADPVPEALSGPEE